MNSVHYHQREDTSSSFKTGYLIWMLCKLELQVVLECLVTGTYKPDLLSPFRFADPEICDPVEQ